MTVCSERFFFFFFFLRKCQFHFWRAELPPRTLPTSRPPSARQFVRGGVAPPSPPSTPPTRSGRPLPEEGGRHAESAAVSPPRLRCGEGRSHPPSLSTLAGPGLSPGAASSSQVSFLYVMWGLFRGDRPPLKLCRGTPPRAILETPRCGRVLSPPPPTFYLHAGTGAPSAAAGRRFRVAGS